MKSLFKVFILSVFIVSFSHGSETVKGAKKDLEAFKKELNVQLEEADANLEILRQKARIEGSHIKKETIEELETARQQLRNKIEDLNKESKNHWKKLKKNLSDSADKLHSKIKEALKD